MLDDNGIRPPLIAAGINLFGGPLGLIHRHVTGAIPIRRNTKDPAYLITLKAYVAEMLKKHDLFFYIEGGRSYSGELKTPKTGLLHAALQAGRARLCRSSRWRSPTTSCSRITSLPQQRVEEAAAAVRARARRDGALRGRLPVARVRHVRRADSARRLRPAVAPRRADAGAPDPRRRSARSTRCCRRRSSPRRCGRRSRGAISRRASTG